MATKGKGAGASNDPAPTPLSIPRRKSSGGHASAVRGHDLLISMLISSGSNNATTTPKTSVMSPSPNTLDSASHHLGLERRSSIGRFSLDAMSASKEAGVLATHTLSWSLFRDPEYQAYLDQLASCSLETLLNQPQDLEQESRRINTQLADLAFTEHRSFLNANACSRAIRSTFDGLDMRIEAVSESLADLEASCKRFEEATTPIMLDRKRTNVVVGQQAKLLDILEIPQLIDTFIRNGYYEEAMELQVHVARLVLRHPDVSILNQISSDVQSAMKLMLGQLISLLRGNCKLPMSIRIIGYLRRMEAFPEPELRLVFLKQKDAYLKTLLDEVGAVEGIEYMKKYTEILREHLFDIVTQYKAIFSETITTNPSTTSSATSSSHSFASHSQSGRPSFLMMPESTPHATMSILSSYAVFRIHAFSAELTKHIAHVTDANAINSLLTQTMYFGLSMGRVGMDFRDIVAQVFEDAIERNFGAAVGEGARVFVEWTVTSDGTNIINKSALSMYRDLDLTTPSGRPSLGGTAQKGGSNAVVPSPNVLLSYPHLATLLNSFYSAYNQLRVVAPTALFRPLAVIVAENLLKAADALFHMGIRLFPEGGLDRRASITRAVISPPIPSPLAPEEDGSSLGAGGGLGSFMGDGRLADFRDSCQTFVDVLAPAVLEGFLTHLYGSISCVEEAPPVAVLRGSEVKVRVKDVQSACRSILTRYLPLPLSERTVAARRRSSAASKGEVADSDAGEKEGEGHDGGKVVADVGERLGKVDGKNAENGIGVDVEREEDKSVVREIHIEDV
ncbi:conserved oligomeric Golgi complex component [Phlyctochytrium planicorne]|nr:conserved oligomeric Golgi complex component [Phlyctochytrium planicorne]